MTERPNPWGSGAPPAPRGAAKRPQPGIFGPAGRRSFVVFGIIAPAWFVLVAWLSLRYPAPMQEPARSMIEAVLVVVLTLLWPVGLAVTGLVVLLGRLARRRR
jgi:hypothetical protein